MVLGLPDWASIAAIVSAMCDVITTSHDTFDLFYQLRLDSPEAPTRAEALRKAFSTYSDEEIDAIHERIEDCRRRFIEEGSGERRKRCLCSVLTDVKDGNGGTLPVGDWEDTYDQLGCAG